MNWGQLGGAVENRRRPPPDLRRLGALLRQRATRRTPRAAHGAAWCTGLLRRARPQPPAPPPRRLLGGLLRVGRRVAHARGGRDPEHPVRPADARLHGRVDVADDHESPGLRRGRGARLRRRRSTPARLPPGSPLRPRVGVGTPQRLPERREARRPAVRRIISS